jgi:hypothetical protein
MIAASVCNDDFVVGNSVISVAKTKTRTKMIVCHKTRIKTKMTGNGKAETKTK